MLSKRLFDAAKDGDVNEVTISLTEGTDMEWKDEVNEVLFC